MNQAATFSTRRQLYARLAAPNPTQNMILIKNYWGVFILIFILAALLVPSHDSRGQDRFAEPILLELDGQQVKVRQDQLIKMEVSPAKVESPALKHRLFPSPSSLKPGDAATFYHRAIIRVHELRRGKNFRRNEDLRRSGKKVPYADQTFGELSDLISKNLGRHELRELKKVIVLEQQALFGEIQTATRLRDCDWGFEIVYDRPLDEYIGFLLPEMQELRSLSRFLALKAKVEITEGKFADAIETMRNGFKMSKATEETRFVICSLIGIACSNQMLEMVEQFVSQPDSPNLYWALATLPRPLVSVRPAFVHELEFVRNGAGLSILQDPEHQKMTAQQWNERFQKDLLAFGMTGLRANPAFPSLLALRSYPIAKRELIESGMPADQVNQMPAAQVISIHQSRTQRIIADELLKFQSMDYATIKRQLARMKNEPATANSADQSGTEPRNQETRTGTRMPRELIPVTSTLIPSLLNVMDAEIRLQRRITLLQTIEAIRLHAALTGGLPRKLSDIESVPVPREPLTGQPFRYVPVEGGFQLWEMLPDNSNLFTNSKIIQISLRQ